MKKINDRSRLVPQGWHTVTPRIVVHDTKSFVEFLKSVFAATGVYRENVPTEIRIGDSIIMVSEANVRRPLTAFLYVYVISADETYQRAISSGANPLEEPFDTPYGDRRCMVEDPWGNTWQIATYLGNSK